MCRYRHALTAATFLLATSAGAQTLNLFEQTEAEPQQAQPRALERAAAQQNGQPAFTLRSTSRFGDEYRAVLVERSGRVVQVRWRDGEPGYLAGFDGFALTAGSTREVTLQQPAMEPCIEAPDRGVQCLGANVAVLQLSTAQPMKSNGTPVTPAGQQSARAENAEALQLPGGPQVVINPFSGEPEMVVQLSEEEQLARQERQQARTERLQQMLEANRIDPANVRQGFRVVRTPFGDREVPVRE